MSGLPWIKVDVSSPDHPKIRALALELNIPHPQAVGHVIVLWTSAGRLAPSGRLSVPQAGRVLESFAGWTGEPGAFAAAALACRLVDRTDDGLAIHDWDDHAGAFVEANRRDAERKRKKRAEAKASSGVPRTSAGRPAPVRTQTETETKKISTDQSVRLTECVPETSAGRPPDTQQPPAAPTPPADDPGATLWAAMQRTRAGFSIPTPDGLGTIAAPRSSEASRPRAWTSWCAARREELGEGWEQAVFSAYCLWLRDPAFAAKGWATQVFMSERVFRQRCQAVANG